MRTRTGKFGSEETASRNLRLPRGPRPASRRMCKPCRRNYHTAEREARGRVRIGDERPPARRDAIRLCLTRPARQRPARLRGVLAGVGRAGPPESRRPGRTLTAGRTCSARFAASAHACSPCTSTRVRGILCRSNRGTRDEQRKRRPASRHARPPILRTLALEPQHGWAVAERLQQIVARCCASNRARSIPRSIDWSGAAGSRRAGARRRTTAAPGTTSSPRRAANSSNVKRAPGAGSPAPSPTCSAHLSGPAFTIRTRCTAGGRDVERFAVPASRVVSTAGARTRLDHGFAGFTSNSRLRRRRRGTVP